MNRFVSDSLIKITRIGKVIGYALPGVGSVEIYFDARRDGRSIHEASFGAFLLALGELTAYAHIIDPRRIIDYL